MYAFNWRLITMYGRKPWSEVPHLVSFWMSKRFLYPQIVRSLIKSMPRLASQCLLPYTGFHQTFRTVGNAFTGVTPSRFRTPDLSWFYAWSDGHFNARVPRCTSFFPFTTKLVIVSPVGWRHYKSFFRCRCSTPTDWIDVSRCNVHHPSCPFQNS